MEDDALINKYLKDSGDMSDEDLIGKYTSSAQGEGSRGAMPFVNRGIAQTVGAPVDLITAGINLIPGVNIKDPVLGRESIESGMRFIGIDTPEEGQEAETIPEHMGQVVGEATAFMNPVTAATRKVAQGATLASKVAAPIWNSMVKHPYLAAASELTGAGMAGVGRGVAQEEFPDSPFAQTSIEVASGLLGGIAPTTIVNTPTLTGIRAGKHVLKRLFVPFTKQGAKYRSGKFAKSLTPDPGATTKAISEETISDLPPAVASGEKKIVELYKGLVGLDPVSDQKAIEKISRSVVKLEGEMRKLGYGSPELLTEITEKRIAALELNMDRRIVRAGNEAQKKLDALPVAQRKASESRIVENELRKAMLEHRASNKELWGVVNKDLATGFEKTKQRYDKLLSELGKAQLVDVPIELKTSSITSPKAAGAKKRGPAGFTSKQVAAKKKDSTTTLREMQALRSKLLETSRNARKEGQWNKSRIAEDVADAILEDLDAASQKGSFITREDAVRLTGETSEDAADIVGKRGVKSAAIRLKNGEIFTGKTHGEAMQAFDDAGYSIKDWKNLVDDADGFITEASDTADLRAALADTKRFKTRFESGEAGKLLGYSKSGAPAINPDLALEVTVGRFGERGAIDLNKVVVSPEARAATERYLGRSFSDYAASDGTISSVKADRWIKNNEAILDKFPDLKAKMSDSTKSQAFADDIRTKMDTRKKNLRNPKISASAKYLNRAEMSTEIDNIFHSRHPSRLASELVKQTRKDTSGDALEGLRAGFVEHILEKASKGPFNELGEQSLSGSTMLNFIKQNESTFRVVFGQQRFQRMIRVSKELAKIESFKSAKGKPKIELEDWASRTLATAGRLVGAEIGGKTGGSMGGSLQHANIVSQKAKVFMNWISRDTAQQLVTDAVVSDDPALLKSLLGVISKPKPSKRDIIVLNKNLNLWLLSTGQRVMQDIENRDN